MPLAPAESWRGQERPGLVARGRTHVALGRRRAALGHRRAAGGPTGSGGPGPLPGTVAVVDAVVAAAVPVLVAAVAVPRGIPPARGAAAAAAVVAAVVPTAVVTAAVVAAAVVPTVVPAIVAAAVAAAVAVAARPAAPEPMVPLAPARPLDDPVLVAVELCHGLIGVPLVVHLHEAKAGRPARHPNFGNLSVARELPLDLILQVLELLLRQILREVPDVDLRGHLARRPPESE